MASTTPENARRESDIQASLQVFDAVKFPAKRRTVADWFRMPVLIGTAATVLASIMALVYMPQGTQQLGTSSIDPPQLRLALPAELPAARLRDLQVMRAFSGDLPQYFTLPWDRGQVLVLLAGEQAEALETVLFVADGRRLVVMPRRAQSTGTRGQDDGYRRFAIAIAGLALLASGADLGPKWSQDTLWAEASSAANGVPAREVALSVLAPR